MFNFDIAGITPRDIENHNKTFNFNVKELFTGSGSSSGGFNSEYEILPYLEADGSHYIETDIIATNETGVYFKGTESSTSDQIILGAREDSGNTRLFPIATVTNNACYGRNTYYRISEDTKLTPNVTYEQWYNFYNDKKAKATQDGIGTISRDLLDITFTPTYPLYLFCGNIYGTPSLFFKGTLEKLQFTEGTELIRDFVPVQRKSDGIQGVYDKVYGKFYRLRHKDGLKNEYVTSLYTNGGCWFETGHICNQDTEIRIDYMFTSPDNRYVYGDGSEIWVFSGTSGSKFGGRNKSFNEITQNMRCELVQNKSGITYNGTFGAYTNVSTFTSSNTMVLGAMNNNLNASSSYIGYYYRFQIYQAGELVLDWIPYVDADGKACFYDTVTGTNVYNIGTGTLEYKE